MIDLENSYRVMYLIRCFEEKIFGLFEKGILSGTTHAYIGQEANAVAVVNNIDREKDIIFSNHRCHGHFIAYCENVVGLMAELMGRSAGVCNGRGGSQHLHYKNFYTNGVQGGMVPNAAGMALAEKLKQTGVMTVVFIGDGTLGQGEVYESLNMISLWELPMLLVCENNHYAQSTKIENNLRGSIIDRAKAFDIATNEISSTDVEEVNKAVESAVSYVKNKKRPFFQVIHTNRLCPHSKSDDGRDPRIVEKLKRHDPLLVIKDRLDETTRERIEKKCIQAVEQAYSIAIQSPFPEPCWTEIHAY